MELARVGSFLLLCVLLVVVVLLVELDGSIDGRL